MAITGANGVTYNSYSEYVASGTTVAGNNNIVASPSTPSSNNGIPTMPSIYAVQQGAVNPGFVASLPPQMQAPTTPTAAANAGWSLSDITSWFQLGTTAINALIGNVPALIGSLAVPTVQAITPILPAIGAAASTAVTGFYDAVVGYLAPTPKATFLSNQGVPTIFIDCVKYRTLKGIPQAGSKVTKAQAIDAVTDFYSGAIPKICAANIVVDYFASTPYPKTLNISKETTLIAVLIVILILFLISRK